MLAHIHRQISREGREDGRGVEMPKLDEAFGGGDLATVVRNGDSSPSKASLSRPRIRSSSSRDIDELLLELDYDCGPARSPDRIRPRKALISGSKVDLSSCKLQKTSDLPRIFVPCQSSAKPAPESRPRLVPLPSQSPPGEADRDGKSRVLHNRGSPKRIRPARTRKCISLFLANSDVKRGLSNSVNDIVACDNIFCTKCDNSVLQIERGAWTAETDYVFIRNSFPDETKLRARIQPSRLAVAYTCQCSWLNVHETKQIGPKTSLRWICSGHKAPSSTLKM